MPSESDANLRANPNVATDGLRKKQLLIVLLVIGLIAALLTQPEESESIEAESTEVSSRSQPVTSKAVSSCAMRLPTVPLRITEYDPVVLCEIRELSRVDFADILQLELLAPESDQPQEVQGTDVPQVQAVYGTALGRTALVGESIVRGGHALPGGGRVLGVTEEGIRVGLD